jgi:HlyD family secretion protein
MTSQNCFGMTAYVTVPVATAENSLKVPNTALRFRPSPSAAESRTPQQGSAAAAETQSGRGPKLETAVVWKLRADKSLEPVQIAIGITDHAYTEVVAQVKGDLKVGDDVVTASVESKTAPVPR